MKKFLVLLAVILSFSATAFAEEFTIDLAHSSITFKIRHLFAQTKGTFNQFEGKISMEGEDVSTFKAEATVSAPTIDTGNEHRDKHLRSKDFFDVETYPSITFKSTGVSSVEGNEFQVTGLLNMHGVEKEITLDFEYHGAGNDPWGNFKNGFSGSTKINRKDWEIVWNEKLDSGGHVLGDDVKITIELEGTKV